MDSNTTEGLSMDVDSINAVDASIMSAVDMMQSCTLGDSAGNALKSERIQDVDMDVDMPTNEKTQADEMNIDSPQYALVKNEVRPSPPYLCLRITHPNNAKAPPCPPHDLSLLHRHSRPRPHPQIGRCSQAAAQAPQAPRGSRRELQSSG